MEKQAPVVAQTILDEAQSLKGEKRNVAQFLATPEGKESLQKAVGKAMVLGTEEAKTIYKLRASTAEWVNAQVRNRGTYAVRVRGREKVLVIMLWQAIAHNFGRMQNLLAASPGSNARRESESTK